MSLTQRHPPFDSAGVGLRAVPPLPADPETMALPADTETMALPADTETMALPANTETMIGSRTATLDHGSPADRVARSVLMTSLTRLEGGRLVIDERGRTYAFGKLTADGHGRPPLTVEVRVHHPSLYRKVLTGGSAGLGEAYLDGWFDTDGLTALLRLLSRNIRRIDPLRNRVQRLVGPLTDPIRRLRRPSRARDRRNIHAHYDLGNEFFALFLDPTMLYSSAVFPSPDATLQEASIHKADLLCRRLGLRPGDRVLEIGSGWGGFALHAATRYDCHVTTTTISVEQHRYVVDRVEAAGLSDRIRVLCEDYRDLDGSFDKVVSIEMIEAVDWRDYDTFFSTCAARLVPDGVLGLQAIVIEPQRFDRAKSTQDFIKQFIFPGGCLPSTDAISRSTTRSSDFALTSLEDFGLHYAETLRRWRAAFVRNHDHLGALGFDEAFERMWRFYLCYCEAAFDERAISVVQMTLARPGWRPT